MATTMLIISILKLHCHPLLLYVSFCTKEVDSGWFSIKVCARLVYHTDTAVSHLCPFFYMQLK
jgi:hypothetical protein